MTAVVPVRNMEMQSTSALTVTSRAERSALAAMTCSMKMSRGLMSTVPFNRAP